MSNKRIDQLPNIPSPALADLFPVWDSSGGLTGHISLSQAKALLGITDYLLLDGSNGPITGSYGFGDNLGITRETFAGAADAEFIQYSTNTSIGVVSNLMRAWAGGTYSEPDQYTAAYQTPGAYNITAEDASNYGRAYFAPGYAYLISSGELKLESNGYSIFTPASSPSAGQAWGWDGSIWDWLDVTGGVTDGDKGDITVSSGGTVWTIDNNAVTFAKIQQASLGTSVIARSAASAGNFSELQATANGQFLYRGSGGTLGFTDTFGVAPKFASGIGIQDVNGINLISFPSTVSSAVNYFSISNSISGSNPSITSAGSDSDIGIDYVTKGSNTSISIHRFYFNSVLRVSIGSILNCGVSAVFGSDFQVAGGTTIGGLLKESTTRVVATNGGSTTGSSTTCGTILDPASAIASHTFTMPASPTNNQVHKISAGANGITTLTHNPNSGQTLNGALVTLPANSFAEYQYLTATSTWYRIR